MESVLYLLGTTLLVIPTAFFVRGRKHRLVTLAYALESSSYSPHVLNLTNLYDFSRACLGAILVCHQTSHGALPFFLIGLILTVGTGLQQCFVRERDSDVALPAPIAYLVGIAFGVLPLFVALITLVVAVTAALALRYLIVFHLAGAVCILVYGALMPSDRLHAVLMAGLFCLPVGVALLSGRVLVIRVKEWGRSRGVFSSPLRDVVIPVSGRPRHLNDLRR